MNYLSYSDLAKIIFNNIKKLNEFNYDLIVGIPRSGIIPAYIIALNLNINCCTLNELLENIELSSGITRGIKSNFRKPQDATKILLVDDSISSGESMRRTLDILPNYLKEKIHTLAIISSSNTRQDIDHYFEYISLPRIFEWNLFHHPIITKSAFDIDGVLCVDPNKNENDDGVNYLNFLKDTNLLVAPTYKINTIVTNRLEKYRKMTENWLIKNNIKYEKLVMLNLSSKEKRVELGSHAVHKANEYKRKDLELFYESDFLQAVEINRLTKKPVYCVETNQLITSDSIFGFLKQTKKEKNSRLKRLLKMMPYPLYRLIRIIYRKIR